jgi:EAL domain-containing protein (putative c-di-GMP-specific phosphodiesterase class I)
MAPASPDRPPATVAYLEHYPEAGEGAHRLLLEHFPYCIGRGSSAHYCINSRHVSKEHAQLTYADGEIRIRDLGSTNGTFVNGRRVEEAVLAHGDIVHVAHKEFRFCQSFDAERSAEIVLTDRSSGPPPASVLQDVQYLKELLGKHQAHALFQPIVDLRTRAVLGYEALGRGAHEGLTGSPVGLFKLAAQCNLAPQLSRLLRDIAVEQARSLPAGAHLFLNLHPSELRDRAFLKGLEGIPEALGGRPVVLELHEEAVADLAAMRRLQDGLRALGIGLAYDDFGAGQARLAELAEVPPRFIKLDKALVQGLHRAPARQELVRALTQVSTDLGIRLIAEGIEVAEEAAACLALCCHYGQGYFFGRPQPAPGAKSLGGSSTRILPAVSGATSDE